MWPGSARWARSSAAPSWSSTANLRPYRFGDHAGVMFDIDATVTDSPKYRGIVGAFIADDKLYLMYFLGAVPHYYEKNVAEAEAIIV